jgi:fumarate reductase subunit C
MAMTDNPQYTKYHPKWYRHPVPIFWWIHRWTSIKFITREITSVFVAFYAVVLLFHVSAVAQGPEAYESFLSCMKSPVSIGAHLLALLFALFHSVTWFSLAPKGLVVKMGGKRVSGPVIAGSHFVAWLLVSVVAAWIVLSA